MLNYVFKPYHNIYGIKPILYAYALKLQFSWGKKECD